jgi:hypothetical protein
MTFRGNRGVELEVHNVHDRWKNICSKSECNQKVSLGVMLKKLAEKEYHIAGICNITGSTA